MIDTAALSTGLALIGKATVVSCFCCIFIYSSEIFPTVIRTVAVGACAFWGRVGSLLAPQILLAVRFIILTFANIQNKNEIHKKQLSSVAFVASSFTQLKYFQLSSELSLSELAHSGQSWISFGTANFASNMILIFIHKMKMIAKMHLLSAAFAVSSYTRVK
jgi:hypothetical protein